MFSAAWALFTGSKIGRYAILAVSVLASLFLWGKSRERDGKRSERLNQAQRALDAGRKRYEMNIEAHKAYMEAKKLKDNEARAEAEKWAK